MNCTDIDTHIDDFVDEQLEPRLRMAFASHLTSCESCTRKVEQMTGLLSNLQKLAVPEPSANFEQRVFAEVRRQHKPVHSGRFAAGFATAMAASLAIWFGVSMYVPEQPATQQQIISVAMNQAQTVRLMFDAQSDIQQVSLTIGLPDNMELTGYPGRKQLSWQTSLKKGQNILALPIMAVGKGQGELVAQLSYGDKIKTFRVVLKTANDGVMQYHLQPVTSA